MVRLQSGYGVGSPNLKKIFPIPIIRATSPTTANKGFAPGQMWINNSSNLVYAFIGTTAGDGIWSLLGPGSSEVDVLTGDTGGAISPVGGNITLAGGTNIATAGTAGTITFNLDAAISLATSVTSPLYTVGAGTDLAITAATGENIVMKMGDNGGTNKVSFVDSSDVEVFAIDSDGGLTIGDLTCVDLTATGTSIALGNGATATTVSMATGVGGNTVNVATGNNTSAQTVNIASGASAANSTVNILSGNAASGTITLNLATGNGAKSVNMGNGVDGNTIAIGNGVNTSAQSVSIANGASAANSTVSILSGVGTAGAGTLALGNNTRVTTIGLGNIAPAAARTTTIAGGNSAQNDTVSVLNGNPSANTQTFNVLSGTASGGTQAVNVGNVVGGSLTVSIGNGTNTTAQNVYIANGNSGADSTVSILSGTGTAGAGTLALGNNTRVTTIGLGNIAPAAARTVTICGGDSAQNDTLNIMAGAPSANTQTVNILSGTASGGTQALNMASGASAATVNMGTGAGAKAVTIGSTTTTSSMSLLAGSGNLTAASGGTVLVDATGVLELNSSGGVIGIGNDAVAQNINIGTGAAARTITVGNNSGATSVVVDVGTGPASFGATATAHTTTVGSTTGASETIIQAGAGGITMTGTVDSMSANLMTHTGAWVKYNASPVLQSAANTGVAPTGATADVNLMSCSDGYIMEQYILGAGQTIIAPRIANSGLLVSLDLTASEGAEYGWGVTTANPLTFTIGTSAAFYLEWQFTAADVSGGNPYQIGFRKVQAYQATLSSYTDFSMIGLNSSTASAVVVLDTQLNSGGVTSTNTTDAWTDGQTHTLRINVSAAGVVTYLIDGIAPSVTAAFTFDNGDQVQPFFRLLHGATSPGAVYWSYAKCGLQ